MIEALRENRVRYEWCVGEYHNSVFDWKVNEVRKTNSDGVLVNILTLDNPAISSSDSVDVFYTLMMQAAELAAWKCT